MARLTGMFPHTIQAHPDILSASVGPICARSRDFVACIVAVRNKTDAFFKAQKKLPTDLAQPCSKERLSENSSAEYRAHCIDFLEITGKLRQCEQTIAMAWNPVLLEYRFVFGWCENCLHDKLLAVHPRWTGGATLWK